MDIVGVKLMLENAGPDGSVLTVYGREVKVGEDPRKGWAMVAHEDTVIFGPKVVIDQPNNVAEVTGRGQLRSLTASDVSGNDLSSPSELVIDWAERMKFEGAKSFAVFVGEVVVQQEAKGDKPPAKAVAKPGPKPEIVPVKREELPKPRDAGPLDTATTTSHLWCHQLDLTLDRPVYFNQLRKDDRGPKAKEAKGKEAEPKPKVKLAVATPSDSLAAKPDDRTVLFRETATDPSGAILRGRMLNAKRMDFANGTKQQELYAVGPGQLRLLQPHKSDDDPKAPAPAKPLTPAEPAPLKLTVVNFQSNMVAIDQGGGLFQEATFDKGGVVLRTPTKELTLNLEAHTLPKGSEYLKSEDKLVVSSARPRKDADPNQRLTAEGNAEFRDDTRTGVGDKIVFDGTRATLESSIGRMAALYSNKRAVERQQSTQAKKFVYNSATGVVEMSDTSGGLILPGK